MPYSKYGLTFRKIREQKKLSLSIFPRVGISKPALSKFERGETMMSFESVVCALQEMGVSLEEYENFLNSYNVGEEESLWEEIELAVYQDNPQKLKKLTDYSRNSGFFFMSLASKANYEVLTSEEIDEITDHLYEVEIWSFSELRLFYYSMESLNIRDIVHIIGRFFPEGHELFNSKKHRQYFIQVCCRAVMCLSHAGYQQEAAQFLGQLEQHRLLRTMFQRNLKNLTEGYFIYRFRDSYQGEQKILEGLDIFKKTISVEEFSYYQRRYNIELQ